MMCLADETQISSAIFCISLPFTRAHQCAGRAVYFAVAKYGKAKRPPGVATVVASKGAGSHLIDGRLAVHKAHFSPLYS